MKHKKFIQVFTALVLSVGITQAEIKSLVDAHIQAHGNQLGDLADTVYTGRVKIGYQDTLLDNPALRHAKEVADIINDNVNGGAQLIEECCWRPQPANYTNFVLGTTQDILSASGTPVPEDFYNPSDAPNTLVIPSDSGRPTLPIPLTFSEHMASVFDQMVQVRDGYASPIGGDGMDQFSYDWISTLTAGIPSSFDFATDKLPSDSLASRLIWNWSYQIKKYRQYRDGLGGYDPHTDAFLDAFRDYYAWSCIVCAGAGFYDTVGMYDIDADGNYVANEYYDAIVALLSPAQQAWLAIQDNEGFIDSAGAPAPPLQISLGLTLQSQQVNNPALPDEQATYGTHCHAASEVYIPVDPMALDKKLGDLILTGQEGYDYNTNSYMAGRPNASGLIPTFGDFTTMQNQVSTDLSGTFTELTNADIVYWDRYQKHAMFTGQRFQFAAWSRIDRPWEGTFFPNDIDDLVINGGDGTVDTETGLPYATSCVDEAPVPVTSALYCGQPSSFYDHVEIVSQIGGVVLSGTAGNDLLVADTVGGSTLVGHDGDDCLIGGPGNDNLVGGAGTDTIDGGDGVDSCTGGEVVTNCP